MFDTTFFDVFLSKDGKRLSYKMNLFLRITFLFFLLSMVLAYIFSFSFDEFINASLLRKIWMIGFFSLIFYGAFYEFSITFDKSKEKIYIRSGLLFLYKKTVYSRESFKFIRIRKYEIKRLGANKTRVEFGFFIGNKFYIVDKNLSMHKFTQFYGAFSSFWPYDIDIQEHS